MRFARTIFILAGLWGILVLTPFYWLVDLSGRHYAPPTDYPAFFYGFISVALAFQGVFLLIGWNPARFRPMMIAAMIEKFGYVATVLLLYVRGAIEPFFVSTAIPDATLGILFVAAFVTSRPR
jgi:hypothetical protein